MAAADDDGPFWERDEGHDAGGRQRKYQCQAVAVCSVCGADVELVADTESWVENPTAGKWDHSEYGPAQGVCCGRLVVDSFEGCFEYRLEHLS